MNIKICGITNKEDALYISQFDVWSLGFIFYSKSPRYIEPEKAREIIDLLPKNIKKIGVFVNSIKEEMLKVKEISGIDIFQLHGEETPELCESLNTPFIKAFRLRDYSDLENIKEYSNLKNLYAIIIDSFSNNAYGGTGLKANWSLAKEVKQFGKVILAGGINSSNAKDAISEVKPFALDLSSSVEIEAGIKDHKKIEEFFESV
ncbi:MAG: phosphoribosylanthranilate isomerase [Candidatus Sericytochromatia bacterium]